MIARGSTGPQTFWLPVALNAVYFAAAWTFFKFMYRQAQFRGLLTKLGE